MQFFGRNVWVSEDQGLKAHPPVPSVSTPFHPKAVAATQTPLPSHAQETGGEEVGLASDRGCKAASHAHCAGRHHEVKLPRHGLQQRSARDKEGRGLR